MMDFSSVLSDKRLCALLLDKIQRELDGREMRFMEVCGTHTCSIFQSGLRSMLPKNIRHISGPGCPVCVTHESEAEFYLKLAMEKNVITAAFGDLLRVPGPGGDSLKSARAEGADIHIVYSPLDAVSLAKKNPSSEVVFLGVGFETTAPAAAAAILTAQKEGVGNFSVFSMHKLVPPVLRAVLDNDSSRIDAFLLPGHVCTVTGLTPFNFVAAEYGKPCAAAGFEPADILAGLLMLAEQKESFQARNAYPRAVAADGNPRARALMEQVFEASDSKWRGLGMIPASGLSIREEFSAFDALNKFKIEIPEIPESACRCGEILQGRMEPPECPLFGKKCSPQTPVGPCMVSTEGSCAAYYKYGV